MISAFAAGTLHLRLVFAGGDPLHPTNCAAFLAVVLAALPAAAQAPSPPAAQTPPAPPAAAGPPADSKLPLGAMRHEQPRRDEVDKLEQERLGPKAEETGKKQNTDVDKLYDQLMRRSAPGASGQ